MIITLIGLGLFLLGIILIIIECKTYKSHGSLYESITVGLLVIGFIVCLFCSLAIIMAHVGTEANIQTNQMQYESLCYRLELIQSDYEDVSKTTVISDINEWNKKVYKEKYYSHNLWSSWFYNKKVADKLEYIEYK